MSYQYNKDELKTSEAHAVSLKKKNKNLIFISVLFTVMMTGFITNDAIKYYSEYYLPERSTKEWMENFTGELIGVEISQEYVNGKLVSVNGDPVR